MLNFKNKSTLAVAVVVSAFLLVGALLLAVLLPGADGTAVFSLGKTGSAKLTLNVVEGFNETPIADATIIVVDTGDVYHTDENGMTDVMEVPFVRDTRYDKVLPKPWGEVSLIIYKNGYVPYALFYLQVLEGETREGVKILLFENDSAQSTEPFSIIEGPNRIWVDALVEKYQPDESEPAAE
jgi:hypothetical protein